MSRRPGSRPHGQIRQSLWITSFGPGSMVDLPNHSVLIGGLDSWSTGGEEIVEPRLVEKLKLLFEPNRLLIRTASNAYFTQLMSVISLPDRNVELREAIELVWDFIG